MLSVKVNVNILVIGEVSAWKSFLQCNRSGEQGGFVKLLHYKWFD